MQAGSGTAIASRGCSSPWYRLKFTGSSVIIASRLHTSEVTVSSAFTLFSRSPKSTRQTLRIAPPTEVLAANPRPPVEALPNHTPISHLNPRAESGLHPNPRPPAYVLTFLEYGARPKPSDKGES